MTDVMNKLERLWDQLFDAHPEFTNKLADRCEIWMDIDSFKEFRISVVNWSIGIRKDESSGPFWRGIPIIVKAPLLTDTELNVTKPGALKINEPIHRYRLVTIAYQQPNDRWVYFDDPENTS